MTSVETPIAKRITEASIPYTNDVFIHVHTHPNLTSPTLQFYNSGTIKDGDTTLLNPLTNTTSGSPVDVSKPSNGQYRFSPNKLWILYNDGGTYKLLYNTFYSQDYKNYTQGKETEAWKQMARYCELVNYDDSYCLCLQPASYDGVSYNQNKCTDAIGFSFDDFGNQAVWSEIQNRCRCIGESNCSGARTIGNSAFNLGDENCEGDITICSVALQNYGTITSEASETVQQCATDAGVAIEMVSDESGTNSGIGAAGEDTTTGGGTTTGGTTTGGTTGGGTTGEDNPIIAFIKKLIALITGESFTFKNSKSNYFNLLLIIFVIFLFIMYK